MFYGLSLIVLLVISILFTQHFNSLKESSQQIEHIYKVRNQILLLQTNLIEAENSQRGFIVTGDSSMLQPLIDAQKSTLNEIQILKNLTLKNERQQQILIKLKEAVSRRYEYLYEAIDDLKEGDKDHVKFKGTIENGTRAMDDFKNLAARMEEVEMHQLKENEASKRKFEASAPVYSTLSVIISCVLQVVSFILLIREFNKAYLYQTRLEKKIQELNISNSELEQMTFVSSHDLQEPLRKIRTFSDRLLYKHYDQLDEDGKLVVDRIISSASRMQVLIEDLVDFGSLLQTAETINAVNLNTIVNQALTEIDDKIKEKHAVVNVEELPVVEGHEKQLKLLFINLIDNSLKFSNPDVKPVINITLRVVTGDSINSDSEVVPGKEFYEVSVADNGIGFEKDFAHKIFILFQRLHAQNPLYKGEGVGLAICKRIMINHNGYITANGSDGNGATFRLYFPVKQLNGSS